MTDSSPPRLFIPGPTQVSDELLEALSTPQISPLSEEFRQLFRRVSDGLRELFGAGGFIVLLPTCSTGLMEAAVRNLTGRRCLNLCCGAFSERWHLITQSNGLPCEALQVPWGEPIRPDSVRQALKSGRFDTVTLVHNETSTSVLSPLREIAAVVNSFEDVLLCVDVVSSLGGVPVEFDAWGLDMALTGTQKALGLPPGMAMAAVSERALERAREVEGRGWFSDFVRIFERASRYESACTPNLPLFFALDRQIELMRREGLQERYARHRAMADEVARWTETYADFFVVEPEYRSPTVTTISNTRNIDVPALLAALREHGYLIANGYGPLRDKTFRIGHMGAWTVEEVRALLAAMNEALGLPPWS
jgi:predicted phosphoserine aminotransferase